MADNPFEARLDRLFGEYASRGVRAFNRYEIAEATISSKPPRRLIVPPLPRLGLVLVGVLLAVVGVTLGVGAQLTSPSTRPSLSTRLGDLSQGLLVLASDGSDGTIQVFRPDGVAMGTMRGSTNGCDRLVLTPDGRRIAWVFANPPVNIASLDGLARISVPSGQTSGGWAFSPDRTRVAYLARYAGSGYALTIASLLDGSEAIIARGLEGVQLSPAAWSNADTLALSVTTAAEVGVDVINADGSNPRSLVRLPVGNGLAGIGWMMSWSPDGTRLVYARDNELLAPTDAAVIDLATGRSTPITTAAGQPVSPWMAVGNLPQVLWTPDGRAVAYLPGSRSDSPWTFLDLDTHEARLAPDAGGPPATRRPFWAPDGAHVAFMDLRNPERLAVLTADLSDRVDLVADGPIRNVAWSPDGRQIAVAVGTSIELLDLTGAKPPTRIVAGVDTSTWSRDAGYGCLTWWSVDTP
jgi:WD40 repeat protein